MTDGSTLELSMPIEKVLWPGDPLSAEDLDAFERRAGVSLPDDYRAFMLRYNGGRPIPEVFPIGNGMASLIGELYGLLADDDAADLEDSWAVFADRVPRELMPIGRDAGGSQICLGVGGKYKGRIYLWDHNIEPETPSFENVVEIALSFGAFIDSLMERPSVEGSE